MRELRFDAPSRSRRYLMSAPALVPVCQCAGRCRCGGLVPALLLERLERESEFFRNVL